MRKNNTNIVVKWPTKMLFTLKDLFDANPDCKQITLRTRLTRAIEEKKFAEIGSCSAKTGRPPKMFSATPVSQATLDMAEKSGITLVESASEKLVNVMSVSSQTNQAPTGGGGFLNSTLTPNNTEKSVS